MPVYRTSELARMMDIHPNTVRYYERVGFITRAERQVNNYRLFNEKHVYQVKICRLVFQDFTTKRIRQASLKIIKAAAKWDIPLCEKYAKEYLSIIEEEILRAKKTVDVLKDWMMHTKAHDSEVSYNREQAADIVGITKESIRNWERNRLITLKDMTPYKRRVYYDLDIKRMRIIYMLLQTGYSLSIIYYCLQLYDQGFKTQALHTLVQPLDIDIVACGDRWLEALRTLKQGAKKILIFVSEMSSL